MTQPMTPREKVKLTLKSWCEGGLLQDYASVTDAILTALASGSGDHADHFGGVTDMVDHAELARLAEAATPGPWTVFDYDCGDKPHYDHNGPCPSIQAPVDQDCAIVHWDGFKQEYWSSANGDPRRIEANAAFIAAANPATVLSLLSEIAALRVDRDEWRNWYRKASVEINEQTDRATQAERQRDEAVGLLRKFNEAWRSGCGWLPAMNSLDDEIAAFLANQGADQ